MTDETPRPVHWLIRDGDDWTFEANVSSEAERIQERIEEINLNPELVRVITHLGPGVGQETQALSEVFPRAQIHAIDYYDHLRGSVKQNPRVTFHKGLFVRVLQSGEVPESDVVLMSDINVLHGFDSNNVGLLANLVGKGVLIAWGDNGNIESEIWFQRKFRLISRPRYPLVHEGVYRAR